MSLDDDEDENSTCPICFDTFKFPKLLPCRHTFCKTCLNIYSGRKPAAEDEDSFLCPMCRSNCKIPKGGVRNLPTNFFVEDKIISVGYLCPNCSDRLPSEDAQCRRCVSEKIKADRSSELEDEKEHFDHHGDTLLSFLHGFPTDDQIRTKFRATLLSSIILDEDSIQGTKRVTALSPTHDNKCWVVLGCRPELFKLNSSGEKIKHLFVRPPMTIFDVACRRDGVVLLLTKEIPNLYGILQMDEDSGNIKTLSVFKNFRGHDMKLFPDERIAVAGTTAQFPSKSEEEERYGKVFIISKEGNLISTLGRKENNLNISCLAINPTTGFICWTDPAAQCVEVLLESGSMIGRYSGTSPLFPLLARRHIFKPIGICCDKNGYIIACDQISSKLFVMTPAGRFCGIVTTETTDRDQSPFGNPFLAACSSSGDLWLGDGEIGEVRLYSITNYVNNFHSFPF